MGNYHRDPQRVVARKPHRCIACSATIPRSELHLVQTGIYDGSAYRSRYHSECWDCLSNEHSITGGGGYFEFTPGECEPPERLKPEGQTP